MTDHSFRPNGSVGVKNTIFADPSTPEKPAVRTKNYMKSNIFCDEPDDNASARKVQNTPRNRENTKDRIFGTPMEQCARKVRNSPTYRSSIFTCDDSPNAKPKNGAVNGTNITCNSDKMNGMNGMTNGGMHGVNGNEVAKCNGIAESN